MNQSTFTAYIDGSHHYKSETSGWGFVIEQDGKVYHSAFGQVPNEWKIYFENYAFAKLIEFCIVDNIENIKVKTDYLNLERRLNGSPLKEILEDVQKYIPTIPTKNVTLETSIEHVERRHNKIADKISREYLVELLNKERVIFEEEYKQNKVNGNYKHPKINFFKTNKLKFCAKTMSRSAERRVLLAVKCEYLIVEIGQYKKDGVSFIKVMEFKNRRYVLLEELTMPEIEDKKKLVATLNKYAVDYANILLSVSPLKESLYNQVIGFTPDDKDEEFNVGFTEFLNKINDLFVYEKNLTRTGKESRSTLKNKLKLLPLEDKKVFYKEKAINNPKALQKLLGWDIVEFKKKYQRVPNTKERQEIENKIKKSLKY